MLPMMPNILQQTEVEQVSDPFDLSGRKKLILTIVDLFLIAGVRRSPLPRVDKAELSILRESEWNHFSRRNTK